MPCGRCREMGDELSPGALAQVEAAVIGELLGAKIAAGGRAIAEAAEQGRQEQAIEQQRQQVAAWQAAGYFRDGNGTWTFGGYT